MAIQSSIEELGLFDLLQVLHMNEKTGRLIITDVDGSREALILFDSGSVCMASIHDRSPRSIFDLMEEWGVVGSGSIIEIEKALPKHKSLIECLEALAISSGNHLENFFAARMRESVYNIFKWEKGDCRFIEEDLDPRREIIVHLNTENLILEGARRIDEWSNIKNKVPSRHSILSLCHGNEEGQALNLQPFIDAEADEVDIDDFSAQQFIPWLLNGDIHFYPYYTGTFHIYYNKDWFDREGVAYPPST